MKRRLLPLLIASATALYSCGSPSDPAAEPSNDLRELKIPRNFNFTTTKERQIDLRFRSPDGQPLRNFNMEMRYSDALDSEYSLGLFSTGREGRILTALEFETAARNLIVVSSFQRLPDRTEIPASGSSIVLELCGAPVSTPQKSTPVYSLPTNRMDIFF
jgi:hypothetical protein